MNQKLAQENPDTLTQFQRAARELRVEPILAHSPEAKGRVERSFKTLQDRLVKEMRLAKINSLTQANQYLKDKFISRYNERYTVTPRAKANFHKVLNTGEEKNIAGIFSKQKNRAVQNDFTISHEKQWYQLTKQQPITIQKKDKVIIEQYRDNSVKIRLRGRYLNFKPIAKGQKQIKRDIPWVIAATAPHQQKSDNLIKVGHF